MKKHRWDNLPAYCDWVKKRDKALEKLHTRAQLETADLMRALLGEVAMSAKAHYSGMKDQFHPWGMHEFETSMAAIFVSYKAKFCQVLLRLRVRSYTLAKASESEMIARITGSAVTKIRQEHLSRILKKPTVAGGDVWPRISLYLDKMRRKLVSFAQGAALTAPDQRAFIEDVLRAFPKRRVVRRPKRILKPELMEADRPDFSQTISETPPADVAIDNIDDATWSDMLGAYMDEYVPFHRAPEYVVDLPITDPTIQRDGTEVWYAWEFERDMTAEFVQSVRDGQIEAANENGITDFVVIAIIDGSTCDNCCGDFGCVDFDGLLVSEVEELTGGDQTTPPYHFNCRCTLAPATDSIPEKPDSGGSEFDDWLMTS